MLLGLITPLPLQALDVLLRHCIAAIPSVTPKGTTAYLPSLTDRLAHRMGPQLLDLKMGAKVRQDGDQTTSEGVGPACPWLPDLGPINPYPLMP